MKTTTKEKVTLESKLSISEERKKILNNEIKKCFCEDAQKYEDTVYIMWHCREFCQNANEDMYVCYLIGGIQSQFTSNPILHILESILK